MSSHRLGLALLAGLLLGASSAPTLAQDAQKCFAASDKVKDGDALDEAEKHAAHDVVALCIELSQGNSGDFNPEIAHVLRRCAAEKLYFQMEVLTKVIERLGGTPVTTNSDTTTAGRPTP